LPRFRDPSCENIKTRYSQEIKGRNIIFPNDILFARIEPSIFNQKYIFANDLNGYKFAFTSTEFYIIAQNKIDIKYIFSLLFSEYVYNQIKGKTTGSTGRRRLDLAALKNLEIPVITKIESVIKKYHSAYKIKQQKEAQAEKLLNSIDDYLLKELGIIPPEKNNSLENRIFTTQLSNVTGNRLDPDYYSRYYQKIEEKIKWGTFNTCELAKVSEFIASGKTPSSASYSDEPTKYPIIKVGSYSDEFINLKKVGYTYSSNFLKAAREDIFILSAAHQAEYVGKHIKYLNENPQTDTSFVGELICIRTIPTKCNSMYLFSLLNTDIYKTLINREKTGQTSHIYGKDIKNIKIPLPPPEKQKKIANHINEIRATAKQLKAEATQVLEQTKQEIEQMILAEK
jgi:restriction endonuclease S subunit